MGLARHATSWSAPRVGGVDIATLRRADDRWQHEITLDGSCKKVSTAFRVMVRTPLEHNEYRGHHIMGEPLTSRHDSRRNHHIMVWVRTAALALNGSDLSIRLLACHFSFTTPLSFYNTNVSRFVVAAHSLHFY